MGDILFTSTGENEARLVHAEGNPAVTGFVLVREWIDLRADLADTLFTAKVVDVTRSGPKADGQTYSGTFVGSQVESDSGVNDKDRQIRIRETLTLVTVVGAVESQNDLPSNPLCEYLDTEVNHMEFPDWVKDMQIIQLTYLHMDPASRANIVDQDKISKTEWATKANACVTNATWEFWKLEADSQKDGTLIVKVFLSETDYDETAGTSNNEIMRTTSPGGFRESESNLIKGKDIGNAAGTIAALSASTDRIITDKGFTIGERGEAHIQYTQKVATDFADSAFKGNFGEPTSIKQVPQTGNRPPVYRFIWNRVKASNIASLYAAAAVSANYGTGGSDPSVEWNGGLGIDFIEDGFVVQEVDKRQNGDTTVDIIATLWSPPWSSSSQSSDNTYSIRRPEMEYRSRQQKPSFPAGLEDDPADGQYWRMTFVEIDVKWTNTQSSADSHAEDGLFGSFAKFDRGRGMFYAEKVTNRTTTGWKDTRIELQKGALGSTDSNLKWDVT